MPRDHLSASAAGGVPYRASQGARPQSACRPALPVEDVLTLRIALGRDKVGTVPTRFRYEPERPYEVLVTFHLGRPDEVDWVFSRELLRDGLRGLSGQGDVRLWPAHCPCHGATLHLALESPYGSALLEASAPRVREWLDRTYAEVPEGSEPDCGPTDEQLSAFLFGDEAS
ncbi:SsgA family sporulation/cell division regulator [Kitasatospora sp. LaBMicrA B282]|uniref:SsgA family sporulation/cell division regulator n=1 Tax=Kitasatospora sp. LaBMicrA B282 TaxID=3420949 RepID=UPI003D0978E7